MRRKQERHATINTTGETTLHKGRPDLPLHLSSAQLVLPLPNDGLDRPLSPFIHQIFTPISICGSLSERRVHISISSFHTEAGHDWKKYSF